MAKKLFLDNKDLGLLILRVGLGLSYLLGHGFLKLKGGTETWTHIGSNMSNLGITFAPAFWGLCAALGESLGGLLLMTGILFRPACLLLAFIMIIAILSGLKDGIDFYNWAWPAEMLVVMVALFICGPGKYSLKYR
ncbi:MAG: DoxX family protein [Chitinophagales bacterium]|nr:DoxX family protein [Chitinophagales bacterium]